MYICTSKTPRHYAIYTLVCSAKFTSISLKKPFMEKTRLVLYIISLHNIMSVTGGVVCSSLSDGIVVNNLSPDIAIILDKPDVYTTYYFCYGLFITNL